MFELGTLVAERYRLLSSVGKGGTATVFQAFDSKSKQTVALKVFDGTAQSEEIKAEICSREAKALERLTHARIVRLIDVGRCFTSNVRYIAVEWVEGKTLEEHLRELGPITWERFADDVGNDLLDALCHAFEQDVSL